MEGKLQEKFALLQQMKRDKELKEAKARESQPIDIFAIAGVTLPSNGSTGLNMTIRHDGPSANGTVVGTVKRPRKNRSPSTSGESIGESSQSQSPTTGSAAEDERPEETSDGPRKKLKRSSMAAVRTETQGSPRADGAEDVHGSPETLSESENMRQSPMVSFQADEKTSSTPTPPTPIPSPKTEASSRRNSESTSLTKMLAKDMTHNVQSRSGSVDENEEMVIDMFGRSVPRSRHHSSDEGSDSENERADGDERRRRGGGERRGGDGRDRYSGDEMPPLTPAEEADPYLAASRYLDTAFYPTKIYVGNLPNAISLTTLRTLFSPFGDIEDMNLVEGKDFGFVTYVEPAAAQQALAKMNGAIVEGISIRVNRAKIPERNRRGFAGVAWMDEDGELARLEEEQHQQAAVVVGGFRGGDDISSGNGTRPRVSKRDSFKESSSTPRSSHQLPFRPRSPKLPPKPTGAAMYPPVGMDPRAAIAASRGAGRQILRYDDL
ncbi:hypothetical protein BGX31_008240 [Mortierella sp. GBA43]|nr:hypothetical protein BGX31_008240 [Mortierella sp. GBA43]